MNDSREDVTIPTRDATAATELAATIPSTRAPAAEPESGVVWPPLMGTDIGDYVLLDELGRGGMGIVYKARQKRLDRIAAVKIVMGGQTASREDLELFVAEAQIAAKVRHPNLVGVYGAGQCFGWPYFAMEFVEGISLDARAEEGPMAPDDAARVMAKVARAVAHLHAHKIVHCDLKPANILLDRDNTPFVSDFGLSKRLEGRTVILSEGSVAGTPNYMSPEQAEGRVKETGFASDIYSMGAILYHLLTGQYTFDSDNVSELIDHVVGHAPTPPRKICRSIPIGLEAICLKCLEKKSDARYASAVALAEDLERYLSGEPLEAHQPTLLRRFVRWVIREPALAGRLVAMAVLFVIELVWYHLLGISGPRFHRAVTILVPGWALSAYLFQRLERVRTQKYQARLWWAVTDTAFLTAVLYFSISSVCSPAVICYPLVVAGAGLWHYVSLVRITTVLAMVSYGLLWLEAHHARPELVGPYDRHVVFLAGLAILGFLVARLTRQVQILTRRLSR